MTRKWHINGRFLTQPVTGVQRYAREIVHALDRLVADGHPLARDLDIALAVPQVGFEAPALRAITMHPVGRSGGHAWEQLALAHAVYGGLVSLCNTGPLAIRNHIVCLHDVNTRTSPESYSLAFRSLYRALHPALGRTARQIVTVSNYSAEQLSRYGVADRKEIAVIPNGHEHALRWRPDHSAATRAAAGPDTIVIIGSPAPHKNVGLIVGLAPRLSAAGLRLAVAGLSDDRVFRAAGRQPAADNVLWLGRLSDNELAALLRDSLCLAFPSFAEGFGLPALEAMAIGCPVIVSDRASLPEVCGDAALYASPVDAEAWLAGFLRLRDDPALRKRMIAAGLQRATGYSWMESATLYLKLMAELP